jgi:gamma-glutamyl-gamma-aminobutyrate hydrolase PuuD
MLTIGINTNFDTEKKRINIPNDYINCIIRAGALPVLLPLTDNEDIWRAMVDNVDGMLFPGGEDLHPKLFGEEIHPKCEEIVEERDSQELFTYAHLLTTGKPFLAVCRGIQMVNVAQGGTLYQDIPAQYETTIAHSRSGEGANRAHQVRIQPGTLLHQVLGVDSCWVNSRHHQAIKDVGRGLRVNAISEDGLVEGVELESGYPGIALQWHPENLAAAGDAPMQRLFDWLVKEADKRA